MKRATAANFKILFTSFHGRFLYIKRKYEDLITMIIIYKDVNPELSLTNMDF